MSRGRKKATGFAEVSSAQSTAWAQGNLAAPRRSTPGGAARRVRRRPLRWRRRRVPGRRPQDAGTLALVGHEPGVSDFTQHLACHGEDTRLVQAKFPTGAAAVLSTRWPDERAACVAALPLPVRLPLVSQYGLTPAFTLLVPYLAAHLGGDLGMSAAMIGVVLGPQEVALTRVPPKARSPARSRSCTRRSCIRRSRS